MSAGGHSLADALADLIAAAERAGLTIRMFECRLVLTPMGLAEWDDEMDNCYPNWPDS